MKQPIQNIIVVGQGLRAWLPAAYLSARFPASSHTVTVVMKGDESDVGDISARPNIRHIHQVLQVTEYELETVANAKPALSVSVSRNDDLPVHLPYGNFGLDQAGAEFYQYWRRADMMGDVAPLEKFNLALQLSEAGKFTAKAPNGFPGFEYGYTLSRAGYCNLMRQNAEKNGVKIGGVFGAAVIDADTGFITHISTDEASIPCDMVFDATLSHDLMPATTDRVSVWIGNCLAIPFKDDIAGLELFLLQSSLERLIALLPDKNFDSCETREFDRLTVAELARIDDMVSLLLSGEVSLKLQRKINVFKARGRVALEDYEVFSKAEWLAAFAAHGLEPEHYDRLVDRARPEELVSWLSQLEKSISRVVDNIKR
jgi:hypothetical protein